MTSVFVVEEDPLVRVLYKRFLTSLDFEVKNLAENGEEAVEMFKTFSYKPDFILMNYNKPIKEWLNAAKEILKIDVKTKIFLVKAEKKVKEKALSTKVLDLYDKKAPFSRLMNNIKNFLECNNNPPTTSITP